MKTIYEPKGRAREYSNLACNLFTGCLNGCVYCYAPACLHMDKKEFHEKSIAKKDIHKRIETDLIKMQENKDNRKVLLCFTCDPYINNVYSENNLTTAILLLFNKYKINFQILTKNTSEASKDFILYKKGDSFATSLTFFNPLKSIKYEPFARLPIERIYSLKVAKEKYNINTWVSLEPVIEPEETLKLIDKTYKFVDLYKIGKINNFRLDQEVNWREFTKKVIEKLEGYGKYYYIKESLKKYF